MTPVVILAFATTVFVTSFIAGVFGMAGGMLLMGTLLLMVSVPDAMVLHGVTQMASNGWRALLWRRYIMWRIVARYIFGLPVKISISRRCRPSRSLLSTRKSWATFNGPPYMPLDGLVSAITYSLPVLRHQPIFPLHGSATAR